MGGGIVSDGKSYTIRFTPEDYAILDALCQQFGLKRPDALRRALRVAQAAHPRVTSGIFSPIGAQGVFQVRTGGADDAA
jgi:acetyl-CoA carboxylase alpha subunit